MHSDLDRLFRTLEMTHPELYAHRSKEEVDLDLQQIYSELDRPMTQAGFYIKVAPLVNSLGDSHTTVMLPPDAIDAKELFFPLDVEFQAQQAFITADYTDDAAIQLGSEILEINGMPLSDIREELKNLPLENSFCYFLWFILGSIQEYQVKLIPPSATGPVMVTVQGTTLSALMQRMKEYYSPQQPLVYETLPDEKIGILTIHTFYGGPGQYLLPAFTQIQEDGIQQLIIDIRSNGGGTYDQVDTVLKYLTNQPYRQCSRRFVRYVVDVASDPREVECDLIQPLEIPLRFKGDLYLLVGPDTYSAAITFATILQDYHLALLIGEETTDTASYCGYVENPVALPRTHLLYRCPVSCYVRPSGVLDDRGVMPDVIVETTLQDRLAGMDPVLAYALELIRSQNPEP